MLTRYLKTTLICAAGAMLTACDFEDKNTNPNESTFIKPGPLLTYTQLNTSVDGHAKNMQIGCCMMMVQQTATQESTEAGMGDKYYMMQAPATSYFLDFYSTAIKNWREMEYQASLKPEYQNMQAVAKIWGAFLFQRMTDLYGNVPYSEAGMGFQQGIYKPKYDTQESIYKDMIEQVKAGIALLSAEKPAIEGDLFYNGNIDQWKKFGNSLLLRIGMRLSKVNPELAKATAKAAIEGGIMNAAEDMCRVKHIAGGRDYDKNQVTLRFQKDNYIQKDNVKISETFMNHLKATNDPRIRVFCSLKDGNDDPSVQKGLPNGYDKNTISSYPGFTGNMADYSNFNTKVILREDAPTLLLMPSESKLLQAEAALRRWVNGDANELYKEAIRLSMKEQEVAYGVTISDEQVEAYLTQDLFAKADTEEKKLEVLGKEYWVTTFMNGYESYANWRRCGYPKLTPTNYAGNQNNGQIPRRLTYAIDEYTINKSHVEEANQQQGPDNLSTRIWWDKQ